MIARTVGSGPSPMKRDCVTAFTFANEEYSSTVAGTVPPSVTLFLEGLRRGGVRFGVDEDDGGFRLLMLVAGDFLLQ